MQSGRTRLALSRYIAGLLSLLQGRIFRRHPWTSLLGSLVLYAVVVIGFGEGLTVSSNYFVIIPVATAALGFGFLGGALSGLLGLPANLILFLLLGHAEFSPASKFIAELTGIAVGSLLGALSDHFVELEAEIERRQAAEAELKKALAAKELLLSELNHRVRNNLNVVKGLVQLQRNRSRDQAFLDAADELIGRILAISLVHDELNTEEGVLAVEISRYIETISTAIAAGLGMPPPALERGSLVSGRLIPVDLAVHLGLIVNEALTNALKHSLRAGETGSSLGISLDYDQGSYRLRIRDEGPGLSPLGAEANKEGLGLKLVGRLAASIGGRARLLPYEGGRGASFELDFPEPSPSIASASPFPV